MIFNLVSLLIRLKVVKNCSETKNLELLLSQVFLVCVQSVKTKRIRVCYSLYVHQGAPAAAHSTSDNRFTWIQWILFSETDLKQMYRYSVSTDGTQNTTEEELLIIKHMRRYKTNNLKVKYTNYSKPVSNYY